jgi:hypothetical protein
MPQPAISLTLTRFNLALGVDFLVRCRSWDHELVEEQDFGNECARLLVVIY